MPLRRIKKILEYLFANKRNLAILIGLIILSIIVEVFEFWNNPISFGMAVIFEGVTSAIVIGYGVQVTHDIIHDGVELPFIKVKKAIQLGVEFVIVNQVYYIAQLFILSVFAGFFELPEFELEEAFLHIGDIIGYFYTYDPVQTTIFISLCIVVTYISTFFMEIGIGKLADGERLIDAFNLIEIKRYIDSIGWLNYAKDYTLIIITMGILIYLRFGFEIVSLGFFKSVFNTIFTFLLFMLQFIAIGWIYKEGKFKEKYDEEDDSEIKSIE